MTVLLVMSKRTPENACVVCIVMYDDFVPLYFFNIPINIGELNDLEREFNGFNKENSEIK